jgi:hypothetical protein
MTRGRRFALSAAIVGAVAVVAWAAAPASGRPTRGPHVFYVDYFETPAEQGPTYNVEAWSRRTSRIRFFTSFNGERAHAPGRYHTEISKRARVRGGQHPWHPDRKRGGAYVTSLVRRALHNRGIARLTIHARGAGGRVDTAHVVIDLARSDCVFDPPLYPIDCNVPVGR